MSINWAKINKWLYKTIIPVGVVIFLGVIIAINHKDLGLVLPLMATAFTPLLALIDKLASDLKKTTTDVASGNVSAAATDVSSDVKDVEEIAADAGTLMKEAKEVES